jgi:hypothetical protein
MDDLGSSGARGATVTTLLNHAASILETCGYKVFAEKSDLDVFCFEDDSLLGFVWAVENVATVSSGWLAKQKVLIEKHSRGFRKSELKTWNLYFIILIGQECNKPELLDLLTIEEDFATSRKVVRSGLSSINDVRQALYALIPIQHSIGTPTDDALSRLKKNLATLNLANIELLLNSNYSEEAVSILVRNHEN